MKIKLILFLFLPISIFSANLKYNYSLVDSKAYIDNNYFTYVSIKNLYQALFIDLDLEKSFSIKERSEILKLVLKNISMSQNIRFNFFKYEQEKDLIVAFTLSESAFKKARYFILLSTNYDYVNKKILDSKDLKKSYAKWFIPILDELVFYQDDSTIFKNKKFISKYDEVLNYLYDGNVDNDDKALEIIMQELNNDKFNLLLFEYYFIVENDETKALNLIPKIRDSKFREFFEVYKTVKSYRESKYIYSDFIHDF